VQSIDILDKFIIDRRRGVPLHTQILRALRKLIETDFMDGDSFFNEMLIAERLGVSRATVRQALGELSREGILIRRPSVGTVVNKSALAPQGSVASSSKSAPALAYVGFVVPEYDSELAGMLLQKIAEECRRRGHTLHTYYTHRGEDLQRAYSQIQKPPSEECFVLFLPPEATEELSGALGDAGYRTVSIDMPSRSYKGAVTETDSRMAVQLGIDYLRSLGHERITLLVNEPALRMSVQEKIEHFRRILPDGQVVICGTDDWESSYAAAYNHMEDVWNGAPTAIMTVSDPGAWAAMRWLDEQGIDVPSKVSVLGFEDARSSRFMRPALSTIAHPLEDLASAALDLLWQDGAEGIVNRLAPNLIIRESTGPVPEIS